MTLSELIESLETAKYESGDDPEVPFDGAYWDGESVTFVANVAPAPVGVEITDEAVAKAAPEIMVRYRGKRTPDNFALEATRYALEAARPFMTSRPALDRAALTDVLTRHWFEYIGQEEGYDCGCNEAGMLPGMPTVSECAAHLSDMVMALAVPVPTREEIAEALHHNNHDLGSAACQVRYEGDLTNCYERSMGNADAVLALLNGSAK